MNNTLPLPLIAGAGVEVWVSDRLSDLTSGVSSDSGWSPFSSSFLTSPADSLGSEASSFSGSDFGCQVDVTARAPPSDAWKVFLAEAGVSDLATAGVAGAGVGYE